MKEHSRDLISKSINNKKCNIFDIRKRILDELIGQAIYCLPADYIEEIDMPDDLRDKWRRLILIQLQDYYRFLQVQSELTSLLIPQDITPVVLKGMSAAIYYEHPEYRISGDIDIILFPNTVESFEKALDILANNGYVERKFRERHIVLERNGITIELHRYFSKREFESEKKLDEIISNSEIVTRTLSGNTFYSFDDLTNGLIILDHIEQHIDAGLGFRQIIDWLMFAKTCLYNNAANTERYLELIDSIGLLKMCIHIQRLGEIYFDIPAQEWSKSADESTVRALYDLLSEYGNFGHSQDYVKGGVTRVLTNGSLTPLGLQRRGLKHWDAAREHKMLRPFAWVYQLGRDIRNGVTRYSKNSGTISENIIEVKNRLALMEMLEVGRYRK